jgi:hypothetical protein
MHLIGSVQIYALDNGLFVEQVLRSRQVIFVLYDFNQLDSKGAAAVARIVRKQDSHSICINDCGSAPPDLLGPVMRQVSSDLQQRLAAAAEITGNS